MSGTLISSLTWVPRGKSLAHPRRYELNDAELERVGQMGGEGVLEQLKAQLAQMEKKEQEGEWEDVDEDENDGNESDKDDSESNDGDEKMEEDTKPHDPNDLSAFKMDEYDEGTGQGDAMGAFANIKGLTYYQNNDEDPYITLKEDDEEQEREELEIVPTDNVIITARTTEDLSSLDFHVYDDSNEALYTHHDLMIPAFPLGVEWLDFAPAGCSTSSAERTGSFVAAATFDSSIEIWDCDVLDPLYPSAILGPPGSLEKPEAKPKGTGKKKRRQMVQPQANDEYHVQSVLSLSWTPKFRNLLLSGSADGTVKLWDLTRESPMKAQSSWTPHGGEKVQAVQWSPPSGDTAVLSAGWDRTVKVWDPMTKNGDGFAVHVGADVECIRWDPHRPTDFYVSLENGLVLAYDARTISSNPDPLSTQPKWTLSAHDGAASALDVNPHIPGCILTGGMDKLVKVWNIDESAAGRDISLVTSRDLGLGKVFTARWCPDVEQPLTLAGGGSKATLQVWDVACNPGARKAFGDRIRKLGRELKEKQGGGVITNNAGDMGQDSDEDM